jgi:hypothetical protein
MNSFTVRVELHSAIEDDYNVLHSEMESRGFSRLITSGHGTAYHMPWAEYNFKGTANRDHVFELVKAAASATGRTFELLVTESAGRSWVGLRRA